jgi:hypothetical protein
MSSAATGLDQASCRGVGRSARPRAEERVDNEIRVAQRIADHVVTGDAGGMDARGAEGRELGGRVAADLVKGARHPHRYLSPLLGEEASDHEPVSPVATPTAHDGDARGQLEPEIRERLGDDAGGTAAGVLHERGAGNPELLDGPLFEATHLLGSKHRQHDST